MLENDINNSDMMLVPEMPTKQPAEVLGMIRKHEPMAIIDVRSGLEYDMGHVQGAVSMPREAWDQCEFLTEGEVTIVYGSSAEGDTVRQAAEDFAMKGYKVAVMDGGFDAWLASGLPLDAR